MQKPVLSQYGRWRCQETCRLSRGVAGGYRSFGLYSSSGGAGAIESGTSCPGVGASGTPVPCAVAGNRRPSVSTTVYLGSMGTFE